MANRIVNMTPIWGLSALAVGTIGAPSSSTGHAEIRPQTAFLDMPANAALPLGQQYRQPATLALVQLKHGGKFVATRATTIRRSTVEVGNDKNRDVIKQDSASVANAVPAQPLAALPLAAEVGQSVIVVSRPASLPSPAQNAVPIVEVPQVGQLAAKAPSAAAVSSSRPKILPGSIDRPPTPVSNEEIYGTSALNAYKVYFPQVDPPALGMKDRTPEAHVGVPEKDLRVLKKKGSYLFFEDPADNDAVAKFDDSIKAKDAINVPAQIIAKENKGKEVQQLTAPALQKQPLDFGDNLFKVSRLPESAPTATPRGGGVAGQ